MLVSTTADAAIRAWREVLGDSQVTRDTSRYGVDTSSFAGEIPVALRPLDTAQVQDIVRIAQQFAIPVYPISTGHNWGYGTAVPVRSPGVVVDLSGMNRILEFDDESGIVTLEPGVTQGQLSEYLRNRGLHYLVPVTGAGPSCSVLANALERGFGVTPATDHFGAVMSMRVVLPNGAIYESHARASNAASLKWGSGPYLDGLFSQSNLGIVMDASIALQPKSECCGALLFVLDSNRELEAITPRVRQLLTDAGQGIGAINFMSRTRLDAMAAGSLRLYPERDAGEIPPGAWFGFGSVYGSRETFVPTCRLIERHLRGYARKVRVYTSKDIRRLRWASAFAARFGYTQLSGMADRLEAALGVVDGNPSTFALPLAYSKSGRPKDTAALNPARDGCGLHWYSPTVPMREEDVAQFIAFAERTCATYGLYSRMTLTALSRRAYACTIPLLFDRNDAESERRATQCYEELYREGEALGFVPYRMGAPFMSLFEGSPLAESIKLALDPNLVLAPGRYSAL